MRTNTFKAGLLAWAAAFALLATAPMVSAQLAFTIVAAPGSSEDVLDDLVVVGGSGSKADPVKLSVSLTDIEQIGRLKVSGLTKIGQVGSTIYRNSAWLEITVRNTSASAWNGLSLAILNKSDRSVVTDGLSFASLSDTSAKKFDPQAGSVQALGVNPWGFDGSVGERKLAVAGWDPARQWPSGSVMSDLLKFTVAAGDQASVGEHVTLKVLVTNNGKDDYAFLNLGATPIPEVPWTGLLSASGLGAFVLLRRRLRR
ncbi:MAG: hypothetical protein IPM17_15115 [Verrucomicrobia bacterium]|nr:hypothetical protein [Verrucomicrobiota bacterium]